MAEQSLPVSLNLISPDLIRPRLRRVAAGTAVIAIVIGALLGVWINWWVGVIVAVVIAGPVIGSSIAVMRRDQYLEGTTIVSRSGRTATADLLGAQITMTGHRGRTSQAVLRADDIAIVLAMYVGDRGRELPIEALSGLEKALRAAAEWAEHEKIGTDAEPADTDPAGPGALADVLRAQLRAVAIGAGAADRPLHRIAHAGGTGPAAIVTVDTALARELAE